MTPAGMSPYEQKVWDAAVNRLTRERESKIRELGSRASAPLKRAGGRAWAAVPAQEGLERQVLKMLGGMKAVTFDPALRSVDAGKALERHQVADRTGLFGLDLRDLDRSLPAFRTAFTGLAALEGGGSALVVTGAEVSSTVSGGVTVGAAVAAIATDAVTSMALMGRIIGQVAAEYGYDVRLPEEEAYALGVMSLGTATTMSEKTAALVSLRRLTTQMMRRATWQELNQNALVKLIQQVFARLGEKLTKRKLGQAVPVAGILINAGLSAQMADATYRTARDVYRLRFLSEKYGIDPGEWLPGAAPDEPDDALGAALDTLETEREPETPALD